MYLKRIELQGFKSFADKTVIEVHQGITAIVGPNGSGKSNISDAVRWVMGEQSAKTLRGGKMEDVIFSGTQKRKPLGYAEVSLVLDNTSRFLPCDYNEVEITRRVFRSGESEYMINRTACRLRDINEMFMDTGLGRDGYSIVGQGKIAEIVSSKGDERRQIFEEAAGISKYRYRKNEAERKLEHTEDNLVRVRDILSELSERVEPLRRQSEKAIKYLDLREELKGIEVSALLEIIDVKKGEQKKTAELFENVSSEFEGAKKTLENCNEKIDELYNTIREADTEIEEQRMRLSTLENDSAAIENERAIIKNNIENHRVYIQRIDDEIAGWSRREASQKEQKSELENEKLLLKDAFLKLTDELEILSKQDEEIDEEIKQATQSLDEAKDEVINLRQKKNEAQSRIDSIELVTQNIETRRFSIEVDIAAAEDDIKQLNVKCKEIEEQSKKADEALKEAEDKVFDINREFHNCNKKISELKNNYNQLTAKLGEKQGRMNMLVEMEKGLEGYAKSVRDLLKAESDGRYKGKLRGVLSKLISVDKKYITAVETALGNAMQNVVVDDESDAKQAIEFLKENRMGRVTFLPVSTQEPRRLENEKRVMENEGALFVASDVVSCDNSIKNVIEALLGKTVIMDNMDNAVKLFKATHYKLKIVTVSGELLNPGGSITGGSINRVQALLGRQEEIDLLKSECEKMSIESEKLEDSIDELSDKADKLREKENKLREISSEKENKALKLKAEYDMKKSLLLMAEERHEKLLSEKVQISTQQTDTDESKKKLHQILEGSDELIAKAEDIVRVRQEGLRTIMSKREKHSVKIIDKKMEINSAQKDIEIAEGRILDVVNNILNSQNDYNDKLEERKKQAEMIAELEKEIERNTLKAQQCSAVIEALREEIRTHLSGKSGSDNELSELREKSKELNERILVLQGEVMRVETRKNKIDDDLDNAANRLWDDYELTYNSALSHKKDIGSLPEAQKKISQIKGAIKALGNINIDAVEEYKEVNKRYEFLSNQVNDMEKAKGDLEKLIGEMTSIMREQFAEKFVVINKLFAKSFVELFGGGKAEVKLVNPLDTLESPIEIEVQPPGKKLQSITLLSGGEHALTAIALLFALLQVSPAPFLVLDEIEAALDDENVYRFGEYIRNYGNNTQFVVITHRRGTMEAADILYGVTMQERGVSRLLSMKLEDIAFEE